MGDAEMRKRQTRVMEDAPTGRPGRTQGVLSNQWAWRKILEIAQEQLGVTDAGGPQSGPNPHVLPPTSLNSSSSSESEDAVRAAEHGDTDNEESGHNVTGEPQKPPVGERDRSESTFGVVRDKGSHHFTNGVIGPEFCNRLAKNMDFDMTVLWIAAWCRRGPGERDKLLENLEAIDGFNDILAERLGVGKARHWRSSMIRALTDASSMNGQPSQRPLSLVEVTTLIREWNNRRRVLRDTDGSDLLDAIDDLPPDLLNQVVVTLMGSKAGKGSLFTKPGDQYPMWKALNIFRHWSVIGREGDIDPHHKAARVSADKIQEYLHKSVK